VEVIRSWSATNSCGAIASCSQTIREVDTTPPSILCAPSTTLEWGSPWAFAAPTAFDASDGSSVSVEIVSTRTNALCGLTYSVTRTWSAIDSCGNSNGCSQTVTIADTTPPSLICPPPRNVEWGVDWTFDEPDASDVVDGVNVSVTVIST